MAVKNSGNAMVQLRTLFSMGAIGTLSDGQLLEQFANGRGESRELAFAALVERHGPFVLRVCRSVLRDDSGAEDAFQATFLALARKAGSLWTHHSLAPWLHQAAYRAAAHDRSATIRRRSHEYAAATLRPEIVTGPNHANDDELEKIIHEEIHRLPTHFRVAVILCDLEGRTHEQAASYLGCAVGTVKSRLARGRERLRGRLVRRGVAPAAVLAALSGTSAVGAAVPISLATSTVTYATAAIAVPASVSVITKGVLMSMYLSKVKFVLTVTVVVAALAAGAITVAQSGVAGSKEGTSKPQHVGKPHWTYHILISRDGEPPREVAAVELTDHKPISVDAPGALILIQPKRDGAPERQIAAEKRDQEDRKLVVTSPKVMDVAITRRYLGSIRSRHIRIRASMTGYLNEIRVGAGEALKKGDLMFKVESTLNKAEPGASSASILAPVNGVVDTLHQQLGSLVKQSETLATLSDNSKIWINFNVPEKQYLEYMADPKAYQTDEIELVLANDTKFPHVGKLGAIETEFNNQTGNVACRADFPNPDGLLRNGQSGTILFRRKLRDAIVIPQRATIDISAKKYVYVIDKDNVAHRREIVVQSEIDDIFIIKNGVGVDDKIVLEGIRQVHDGEKVNYDFRPPEEVIAKPTAGTESQPLGK